MVAKSDLDTINMLSGELLHVTNALSIFAEGGRIVNLTVASGIDAMPARTMQVGTTMMDYPPQMVEAIERFLAERERKIIDELNSLGVTGIDEPQPRKGERK